MKTIVYSRFAAVAALVCLPIISQATELDPVQRCMSAFATESFAGHEVSFKADSDNRLLMPLVLNSGTRHVILTANDRVSGQVLAKANCVVKNGVTTIAEVTVAPLMASR